MAIINIGEGNWADIRAKINAMFAELYTSSGSGSPTHTIGEGNWSTIRANINSMYQELMLVTPTTTAAPTTTIVAAGVTGFTAPVTGATPNIFGDLTPSAASYTVTDLTWSPVHNPFHAVTAYTATVELTSATGYKFPVGNIVVPTADVGTVYSVGTTAGGNVSGNTLTYTVLFSATATSNLGLNGAVTWLDSTHISVTYDWTNANQLNDFTLTTNTIATRNASNYIELTGGVPEMNQLIWKQKIAVSRITLNHNSLSSTRCNIYTNLDANFNGSTYSPNPSLGVSFGYSWLVNGADVFASVPPVPTANTWRTYVFETSTTMMRTKSSVDDAWYELPGTYAPNVNGYLAIGNYRGYGPNSNVGTLTIEGEIPSTLLNNLISYWKMDDASTPVVDSMGINNGVATGGTFSQASKNGGLGTCILFNGTSDVIVPPNDSTFPANNFSVAAWVKASSTWGHGGIFSWSYGNTSLEYLWMNYQDTRLTFKVNRIVAQAGASNSDTNWHLLVGTYDKTLGSNNIKLYIDGTLNAQANDTTGATNSYINIGRAAGAGEFFPGYIDEVGTWGKTLSQTEINELYNSGSGKTYPFWGDLYGPELVTNGTFDSVLTPWTGTNWSQDTGHGLHTTGLTDGLSQTGLSITSGLTYRLSFTLGGVTAGGITIDLGGDQVVGYTDTDGTYTIDVIAGSGTARVYFVPSSSFNGWLDNISLRLVL